MQPKSRPACRDTLPDVRTRSAVTPNSYRRVFPLRPARATATGARDPLTGPAPIWHDSPVMTMTDQDATDFAVIVYREEDTWEAEVLPVALTEDLDGFIQALRQQPSVGGTIGL